MMRRGILPVAATLALLLASGAFAQTAPRPATPPANAAAPDPAFEVAKLAFEALPLDERRAVQDGLVWTGDFQGVTSGTFGRRTLEAINAYAARLKQPVNGTLDAKARAGLAQASVQAKLAAKFETVAEKRAGITLGLPLKLLAKTAPTLTGQRYAAADNSASLETTAITGAEADLPAQFEKLKAETPSRKVTYKLLRPDFLVVSGEAAGQSFYTRLALSPGAGASVVRGYTFSYASSAKAVADKFTIAIANSFEPGIGLAAPVAAGSIANPVVAVTAQPAIVLAKWSLAATGLAINATQIVTVLPAAGCKDLMVGKTPARLIKTDKVTGLALLEATATPLSALATSAGTGSEVVVAYFDAIGLQATTGEVLEATVPRLRAALQGGHSGGVAFDRNGAFAGLVQAPPPTNGAGPATFAIVPAAAALNFAGVSGVAAVAARQSTGQIVAGAKAALVQVFCTK